MAGSDRLTGLAPAIGVVIGALIGLAGVYLQSRRQAKNFHREQLLDAASAFYAAVAEAAPILGPAPLSGEAPTADQVNAAAWKFDTAQARLRLVGDGDVRAALEHVAATNGDVQQLEAAVRAQLGW